MKYEFWVNYPLWLTSKYFGGLCLPFHLSPLVFGLLPPPPPVPLPAPGEGNWWISEAVNTSQSFHVIDGLQPGAVYTVRLVAKGLLDNASIFEDVIQTRVKGERRDEGGSPSQSITAKRYGLARQS